MGIDSTIRRNAGIHAARVFLFTLLLTIPGCAAAEQSLVALGYWVFLVFGVMLSFTVISARITLMPFYAAARKKLRNPASIASLFFALIAAGCISIGSTREDHAALLLPIGLVLAVKSIATIVWARASREQTHAIAARIIAICFAFAATLIVLLFYAQK